MVGYVKRLSSKFDRLLFPDPEYPNQSHIDSDASRASDIGSTHRPVRSKSRLHKGRGIEPAIRNTLVRNVGRRKHLVWSLIRLGRGGLEYRTGERLVESCRDA